MWKTDLDLNNLDEVKVFLDKKISSINLLGDDAPMVYNNYRALRANLENFKRFITDVTHLAEVSSYGLSEFYSHYRRNRDDYSNRGGSHQLILITPIRENLNVGTGIRGKHCFFSIKDFSESVPIGKPRYIDGTYRLPPIEYSLLENPEHVEKIREEITN